METRNKLDEKISKKILDVCNAIYLIDLKEDLILPYTYHSEVSKSLTGIIGTGRDYTEVFKEFADDFVFYEDYMQFFRRTDINEVKKALEIEETYRYVFHRYNTQRVMERVELKYYRMDDEPDMAFVTVQTLSKTMLYGKDKKEEHVVMPEEYSSNKRELLAVSDKEEELAAITDILSEEYFVHRAMTCQDGLNLLHGARRKLVAVLLDLEMPSDGAISFLQSAKADPFLAHIPILVMTSQGSEEAQERCLEQGAIDLIGKPLNPKRMLTRLRNVTRLREYTQTLSAVEFDELTGLYTKSVFLHYAQRTIENNPKTDYLLLAMDLENFKVANMQYGVQKCDEMLAYMGKSLGKIITNGVLGRFSGDCFVALIPKSATITEEYLDRMARDVLADAPIPNQTVKLGVYGKYQKIDNSLPMVIYCDRAFMAVSKIKGIYNKNVAFFSPRMREQFTIEQKMVADMEQALFEEQFQVYYQPKHDCFNDHIAGAEALIRWKHPELGFLPPSSFVPLFERNGFITKVDAYVMEKVCADLKKWKDAGLEPVPVSVNVSRRDFMEDGWVENCLNVIEAYQIRHSLIHMEVTETIYTENTSRIIYMVNTLREKGYLIEMDDFGAGYSSLGMLTDFPVDVIKLDASFVRKMETNEIVVDTIIQLSHRMGFKLIAEGVETEKQCQRLKELGCDYIQGYFYSKPLPGEEFQQYLCDMQAKLPGGKEGHGMVGSLWMDPNKELEIKNTLLECIRIISDDQPEKDRLRELLKVITTFYKGSKSFIYEYQGVNELSTYEYSEETGGLEQVIRDDFVNSWIENWKKVFVDKEDNYLPSVEELKEEQPDLYQNLTGLGIHSIISVPLRRNDEIYGFIGVENPSKHTDTLFLLSTITHYIVNELNRSRTMEELRRLSFVDSLTGLRNRSAYYHDIEALEADPDNKEKSLGIVYADINGLKRVNDEEGYEAGDIMIRSVANVLKKQFDESKIYRMGNDEFIVLIQGIKEHELTDFVQILKESWHENATASVGVAWLPATSKIEKWAMKADRRMYKAKKEFYSDGENDRRKR